VARDLGRRQGARRENIRSDLRPTSNAAAAPKIRHPPGWQRQIVGISGLDGQMLAGFSWV
jgi:hypothetical protein